MLRMGSSFWVVFDWVDSSMMIFTNLHSFVGSMHAGRFTCALVCLPLACLLI